MKMPILSGGCLRLRKSIYMPDADRAELLDLPGALSIRVIR